MYLNYFGLKREPFQITPDPSFLFLSPGHKEALASIIYGVEKKKGFILIVGPIGVGKTTILRAYLERTDKSKLKTIYIYNSNISYNTLLRNLLRELDSVPTSQETSEMVNQLHLALIEEYRQGRNVLLLIDEAQNMPVDTLENLRMLSNLETSTEKLMQVVFSGQTEFEKTLNLEELRQLKQRIAVKAVISPLTADEGMIYVKHRLKAASDGACDLFTSSALRVIIKQAKGIPRVINVICDNCLITTFGYGKKRVNANIVKEIVGDLGIAQHRKLPFILPLVIVITLIVYVILRDSYQLEPDRSLYLQVAKTQNHHPLPKIREKTSISEQPPIAYIDKVVSRGDTLAKLIIDVYGHVDQKIIRMVKRANPHIDNENVIIEGGHIRFPVKGN